nr:hypothetical protein [Cytophagales bacterium]
MNAKLAIPFCFFWYLHTIAVSQELQWYKTKHVAVTNLDLLSIDGKNQLLIADEEGNIHLYSPLGDSLNVYSPVFRAKLSSLDAFWTTTIFLFSADLQRYELLDRFLNPVASNRIPDEEVGLLKQAAYGNGNVIWMVNETRLSLFKWDFRRNVLLQEQPLSLILSTPTMQVLGMTERKNLLFLQLSGTGMYIFDNQANFIQQVASIPDATIFIFDDHFYYISDNMLFKTNYLHGKTTYYNLPNTAYKKIALTTQQVIFYGKEGFDIFERPTGL